MCIFTEDCDDEDSYWEDEVKHYGMASLGCFGCEACGYSDCL